MTAGVALKVIEYAGIDFFTHAGTGPAAYGTAGQTAEDGTDQATLGDTDRAQGPRRFARQPQRLLRRSRRHRQHR